jgi:hypothetical protein
MSSTGQIVGGVVGAVVGFFVGGPTGALYGAQLGLMAGGLIDPAKVQGPRLDDLAAQTSTYGAFIPRIYGTVAVHGNVIWIQGDRLIERSSTASGKGGPDVESFDYFATFAVSLCEGPIAGVRRIWVGGQLWYDAGSDDINTIIASAEKAGMFTVYTGSETQEPDPLIQADRGAANVPAYRGLAYIVFNGLPLKDVGNSLAGAQIKVEVVKEGVIGGFEMVHSFSMAYEAGQYNTAFQPRPYYITVDRVVFYSPNWSNTYPSTSSFGVYQIFALQNGYSSAQIETDHSGEDIPPNGNTDMPVQYWRDADEIFGLSLRLDGSDGSFICRGGICLGYSNGTSKVYLASNSNKGLQDGSNVFLKTASLLGYACVAVDPGGYNYVIGTSGIKVYDGQLNLVDTVNYSFVTFSPGNARADIYGNFLYILSKASSGNLYRMNMQTKVVELLAITPHWNVAYYYSAEFRVIGGILIQAAADSAARTLNVRVFRFDSITPILVTLSSIVETECLQSELLTAADLDVTDLAAEVRGYRIGSLGPLRGGVDPLRTAWPFDAVQHGYQIKFKARGGASVATIDEAELDAREAGTEPGVQVTNVREMDTVLPSQLTLKYLDVAREYDVNVAEQTR